jgi:putative endonuclease
MIINKTKRSKTGQIGESIAKKFLQKKGYKIIFQNFRTKYSEIDLIAEKKDMLVFIEVRTKTSEQFGSPEQTINKKKISRLIRAAQSYASNHKYLGSLRIDAVCVVFNPDYTLKRIAHYESITLS